MVSGDTPAAAAESLHAKPWAMRRTSARSAGVRLVPSMNLAANGVRISISIWAIVVPSPVAPHAGGGVLPVWTRSVEPKVPAHAPARSPVAGDGDDNNAP